MLINNFEQHLESFFLTTQNAQESARNQVNTLNTSKNELMKIFRGFRDFEYALWQKTKTRKSRKSAESFLNQKQPVLTLYRYQKTVKKKSIYYLSTILALLTEKVTFMLQQKLLLDDFEQQFQSCVLNVRNTCKSAQNQINRLNTSKHELIKIFRGFRIFKYALWQKNENPEMPEINRKLSKLKKHPLLTVIITKKLLRNYQFGV